MEPKQFSHTPAPREINHSCSPAHRTQISLSLGTSYSTRSLNCPIRYSMPSWCLWPNYSLIWNFLHSSTWKIPAIFKILLSFFLSQFLLTAGLRFLSNHFYLMIFTSHTVLVILYFHWFSCLPPPQEQDLYPISLCLTVSGQKFGIFRHW